jgi:type I restriction enzyme S subunit
VNAISSAWVEAPLESFADVILGQSPPGDSYNETGVGLPFFQGKAEFGDLRPTIRKWTTDPRKIAQADDVLLSVRAPVGPTNLAPSKCVIGRGLAALRPLGGIDSRYVLYGMRASADALSSRATGTTFAAVSGSQVRAHPLPLAPLAEQERIVATIEEQFSRLESAEASLRRAQSRVTIFRSSVITLLVEGNWPRQAWRDIARSQNGRAFPSRDYSKEGVKLLRPGNLHASGRVDWVEENTRRLPLRYEKEFPSYVVGPHELVMNLTAQSLKDEFLGRVCLTGPDEHCLLNQRLARLTPFEADARYLLYVFKARPFRRFVDSLNKGSLIQHMFTSQLDELEVPVPPLEEQRRIVEEVEQQLSIIEALAAKIDTGLRRTAALRRSILDRAFTGKLVAQDPADEPASVLLERIAAERAAAPKPSRRKARIPA